MTNTKLELTISWLYPDLMNTYGDRGNILVLVTRAQARGIKTTVVYSSISDNPNDIGSADLLFMGGAQDKQQEIVESDLRKKRTVLAEHIQNDIPGLYVCGAYQLLGNYYLTADNKKIEGLKIFPIYTQYPGHNAKRLVGNIAAKTSLPITNKLILGFENHNGRTFLEKSAQPFASVKTGYGNNDTDKSEGILFHTSIGTYIHGPILAENPDLADWLIEQALMKKYGYPITLTPVNNTYENESRKYLLKKLGLAENL